MRLRFGPLRARCQVRHRCHRSRHPCGDRVHHRRGPPAHGESTGRPVPDPRRTVGRIRGPSPGTRTTPTGPPRPEGTPCRRDHGSGPGRRRGGHGRTEGRRQMGPAISALPATASTGSIPPGRLAGPGGTPRRPGRRRRRGHPPRSWWHGQQRPGLSRGARKAPRTPSIPPCPPREPGPTERVPVWRAARSGRECSGHRSPVAARSPVRPDRLQGPPEPCPSVRPLTPGRARSVCRTPLWGGRMPPSSPVIPDAGLGR